MNDQDRKRIDALEAKIDDFFKSLNEKFDRWDALYYAVIGNSIDSKAGIVNRIVTAEKELAEAHAEIEKLKASNTKIFVWATAISFMVSTLWQAGKLLFEIWTR